MSPMAEPPADDDVDEFDPDLAGPDWLQQYVAERERRSPGFAAKVRAAEQQILLEEELRRRGLKPADDDED